MGCRFRYRYPCRRHRCGTLQLRRSLLDCCCHQRYRSITLLYLHPPILPEEEDKSECKIECLYDEWECYNEGIESQKNRLRIQYFQILCVFLQGKERNIALNTRHL